MMSFRSFVVAALLGLTAAIVGAQVPVGGLPSADGEIPPDFRGRITWRGFYQGRAIIPAQGTNVHAGNFNFTLPGSQTVQLGGDYVATFEFTGNMVHGQIQTSGALRPVGLNGTRDGTMCHLVANDGGRFDAYCGRRDYRVHFDATNQQRQHVMYDAQAQVVEIANYDEDERNRQLALQAQQPNPAPPAVGRAVGARASSGSGLVDADSDTAVNALKGVRHIAVRMENIDDIGIFVVVLPDGSFKVASAAEWTAQNRGGTASEVIDKYFKPGRNGLIFLLHNKQFSFGPGKWSFSAETSGDDRPIWAAQGGQGGGGVGIQYWKAMFVTRKPNGTFDIEASTPSASRKAKPVMEQINARLIASKGSEQSVGGLMAGALIQGIMAGPGDEAGGKNCDVIVGAYKDGNPQWIKPC